MPSRASRAADRMDQDRANREAGRPDLKAVPDLQPDDPAKPATAGDAARLAARDALPPHQQAEYDRLTAAGTRHVTALGQARKHEEPAAEPEPASPVVPDMAQAAADLFAAFTAGAGGAAAPPATVADAAGKPVPAADDDEPAADPAPKPAAPRPVPKPEPAQPKAKAAPAPRAPRPPRPPGPTTAAAADGSDRRHIGTVTLNGVVHDCEHGQRNGHMEVHAAETCALRLMRTYPDGTPGTRLHPVRRDRSGRRLS
jgi:hypothetical protein